MKHIKLFESYFYGRDKITLKSFCKTEESMQKITETIKSILDEYGINLKIKEMTSWGDLINPRRYNRFLTTGKDAELTIHISRDSEYSRSFQLILDRTNENKEIISKMYDKLVEMKDKKEIVDCLGIRSDLDLNY